VNAFFATLLAFAADPIALKARVTDQTGLLSNSAVRAIESLSESLERDTKVQLAVFVVSDLGGRSIEEFSLKTAELSGLGQKKKDNGVLLVVARGSRAMRIEVGYGLEGILTDVVSSRIIRNVMVPEFRAGRFDSGVIHGTQAIADRVRDPNAAEVQGDAQGEFRRPALRHSLSLLVIILFALLFGTIASFQNRHRFRRRGGWWNFPPSGGGFGGRSGGGFGGFGGGGFSGGGGSFGGGGASGRW
jgi:uncharacterized protein